MHLWGSSGGEGKELRASALQHSKVNEFTLSDIFIINRSLAVLIPVGSGPAIVNFCDSKFFPVSRSLQSRIRFGMVLHSPCTVHLVMGRQLQ